MEENKEVEQLEDVEELEAKEEQIVIEEEHHSKFDNLTPRTEMAEMSKTEKEEIKAEVLGIEPKPVREQEEVKLDKPSKSSNLIKTLAILILVLAVGCFLFIMFADKIMPN